MVRLTDRPDMTLDVYRGRKTTMQQQQQIMPKCVRKNVSVLAPWCRYCNQVHGSVAIDVRVCFILPVYHQLKLLS